MLTAMDIPVTAGPWFALGAVLGILLALVVAAAVLAARRRPDSAADDLPAEAIAQAGAVIASGITRAISPRSHEAVRRAARTARRFVYDPNFRPRLTTAPAAAGTRPSSTTALSERRYSPRPVA